MSMNWSLCAGPWGALASGAAQRAFAKQGLVSQPEQQSGTDGRRERSSATPVVSASSSPLLSAAQIRSPVHLPARPASEEGLIASSALPAAIHPGTRHAGNVVLRGGGWEKLICFVFNGANYPCNCPPKREKGVQDPWQLLSMWFCCQTPALPAADFCLHPDFLVLYTVDVEQCFSLCFSRPVPLYSLQFLLLGSPCPFLNDV